MPPHEQVFNECKQMLPSANVLHPYDKTKPFVLTCDALAYDVGAILGHRLEDDKKIPVAFYSRTLTSTERYYAKIDKEAFAVVGNVKKSHDYMYGRRFDIITDHKPLLGLFTSANHMPYVLSPWML